MSIVLLPEVQGRVRPLQQRIAVGLELATRIGLAASYMVTRGYADPAVGERPDASSPRSAARPSLKSPVERPRR